MSSFFSRKSFRIHRQGKWRASFHRSARPPHLAARVQSIRKASCTDPTTTKWASQARQALALVANLTQGWKTTRGKKGMRIHVAFRL